MRTPLNEVFALLGFYVAYIGSFFTDVSGQPIGPILKGQAVQEDCFSLEDVTDILSQNVGNKLSIYAT
jgi:hypothetical protein